MTGPYTAVEPSELAAAREPTMYFVGVTTGQSAIMRIFPEWRDLLGLGEVRLVGVDLPIHADRSSYRRVVEFIANDPLSLGALVTTHKIDIYEAAHDMFHELGNAATLMREISCIWKRNGTVVADALDPLTGGLAVDEVVAPEHWKSGEPAAVFLGAGGSTIAISWFLGSSAHPRPGRPSQIIVTNRSMQRLDSIRQIHDDAGMAVPVEYIHAPSPSDNSRVVADLSDGSLVVNATGLGKDAVGSPLSEPARFPSNGVAWDLNYRGDLVFLEQAKRAGARAVDGWGYFIHGWTQHVARITDTPVRVVEDLLDDLTIAAERMR